VARHAALAALLAAVACASPKSPEPPPRPAARVLLETASGRHAVAVEVVRSDEERARGLMNRTRLDPDAGMLFVFEESDDHAFWMKNTFLSLDMIFIDEQGRVAGVLERVAPLTTEPRTIGRPSRFVLEVNGGWAAAHGVRPGDAIRFENVPLY
jgi:uncharacterized membrane protein (UPF0127 family)